MLRNRLRLPQLARPKPDSSPAGLAERIWALDNLRQAWRRVRANKGGPGVDHVSLQQFERDLDRNLAEIQRSLQDGRYQPQPFLRVLIPKSDGDLRPLAIPTIRDRVIQRAAHNVIDPLCDATFQACSFGFRQGLCHIRIHPRTNCRDQQAWPSHQRSRKKSQPQAR